MADDNRAVCWGNLFKPKSDHPKAPAFEGDVEISKDVLLKLVDDAKNNRPVKLNISLYQKQGERAGSFFGIRLRDFKEWRKNPDPISEPRGRGNPLDDLDDGVPF